jgi:hypothetical protein
MNLFNESDFHWHFAYQIKNEKNINEIKWQNFVIKFIFWKKKINYNKIIMSTNW